MPNCKHKTHVIAEHAPFAYHLLVIRRGGTIFREVNYVGQDAAAHFVESIVELEEDVMRELSQVEPMLLTEEDEAVHELEDRCYLCGGAFWEEDDGVEGVGMHGDQRVVRIQDDPMRAKVRDHCHLTGEYLGAAHNRCNLSRREARKLVGFAHNFSGYDSHLIMKALAEGGHTHRLSAIPLNTERFKMLRVGNIVMLDSLAFLPASLDKLVENLKLSDHDFPLLDQWLSRGCHLPYAPHAQAEQERMKELLLRKGVYPYEYMTSIQKLKDRELPNRVEFYSKLTGGHVSDEDYAHAQMIWSAFRCK